MMERGRLAQVRDAAGDLRSPKTAFVAGFLNMHTGAPPISSDRWAPALPWGEALADAWVGVRPEHVVMSRTPHPAAAQRH